MLVKKGNRTERSPVWKKLGVGLLALTAAGLVVLTQTAASKSGSKTYQLGGTWEGQVEGVSWVGIHAPLDPNGKRAAIKWQWMTANADLAQLMQAVGGTSFSDAVGDIVMVSPDIAQFKIVTYVIGPGMSGLPELKLKGVMTGEWRILDENTAESAETLRFYLPDGTPTKIPEKTYATHPHHRISVP